MSLLIGTKSVYVKLQNWLHKEECKHAVLLGTSGCGKTSLKDELVKHNSDNYEFIQFDCSQKLSKRHILENIEFEVSHVNIISSFHKTPKSRIVIIDEIDGILDTDNLSLCEIANVLKSKNIKVLFISSKKGSQKLKDVIDNEIVFKIEYLNKQEIYKYFKPLYPKVKAPILNSLIAKHGDNMSALKNELEFGHNVKEKTNVSSNYDLKLHDRLVYVKKSDNYENCLLVIESDIMNLMFCIQENYNILFDSSLYIEILHSLYLIDYFYYYMFENQIWDLNKYTYIIMYNILKSINLPKSANELKVGTLWSKYSNWQYKKKLYNNFSFYQPNCIFHNMNFVYYLCNYICALLVQDQSNMTLCISYCKKLNINKEKFDQLLRICPNYDKFKGTIKNKFIKELKKEFDFK